MKRISFASICTLFLLFNLTLTAFQIPEEWDELNYEELWGREAAFFKNRSPEAQLEIARYLIRRFPEKDVGYGAASSVLTLKRQYEEAEKVLQEGIKNVSDNTDLIIRLGHFYRRVEPEKLEDYINDFRKSDKKREDYHLLLAKLYRIAGKEPEAIIHLEKALSTGEAGPGAVNLLVRMLRKEGKDDSADSLLSSYIQNEKIPIQKRIEFFKSYLESGNNTGAEEIEKIFEMMADLALLMETYPERIEFVQESTATILQKNKVDKFRNALENLSDKPKYFLIKSRSYRQLNEEQIAVDFVKNYQGENIINLEEKARVLSEFDDETTPVLRTWIKVVEINPSDSRLRLTLAQYLNRRDLKKESLEELNRISPDSVDDSFTPLYFALLFDNLSDLKKYDDIISNWKIAGNEFEPARLQVLLDGVFANLPLTEHHREIMKRVENTDVLSLLLLKARTAKELRDFDLYYATMDKVMSQKKEVNAEFIYPVAEEALQSGIRIAPPAQGEESVPQIVKEQYIDFAEKWIKKLREKHPQIPDYHSDMVMINLLRGKHEKAVEMVKEIASKHPDDPERQQLAGYVLARSGFPAEALEYYVNAIKMQPDNIRFRMNYAACLTRLERYKDALGVYEDVITGGYTARTWDPDELLGQVYRCYEKMENRKGFFDFVHRVSKCSGVNKSELFLSAGSMLSSRADFDNAIRLLTGFIDVNPNDPARFDVWFRIAECYAMQEKFDKAIETYNRCRMEAVGNQTRVVDCIYNIGEMKKRAGQIDEALETWEKLAETYPSDKAAQNALVAAAFTAEMEMKNSGEAIRLFRKFLKMNPEDPNVVRMVEERLTSLEKESAGTKN